MLRTTLPKDDPIAANCDSHSARRIDLFSEVELVALRWHLFTVAQIFNLLYRRFVIGRTSDPSHAPWFACVWQGATLRYSRLQVCATGVGNTVNTYSRPHYPSGIVRTKSQAA